MSQDLASCTAAKNRGAAAACTRVMESGRLPREQMYIGYFNRGTAYRRAGDFDKAVGDFSKVLELKPGFARAYEARGMTEDDRGNRDKALADVNEAIKRDDKAWQFLYSRAVVLRADGDTDSALRDLDAAGDLELRRRQHPLDAGLGARRQGLVRRRRASRSTACCPKAVAAPRRVTRAPLSPSRKAARCGRRGRRPGARTRRRLCRRAHAEGPYSRRARRQVPRRARVSTRH